MTDGETTVWVCKPNGSVPTVYHTSENCNRIPELDDTDDWTIETLPWEIPECKWCAGEVDVSNGDRSYIAALKDEADRLESEGSA